MQTTASLSLVLTATLLLPTIVPEPSAAAAKERPRCESMGFSSASAKERIGFCVGNVVTPAETLAWGVFRTDDEGRSWTQTEASGLPYAEGDILGSVIVSPMYDTDSAVFVQVGVGIYRSVDEGDSFALVDGLSGPAPSGENLVAFVGTSQPLVPGLPPVAPHTILAYSTDGWAAKIDPPLRTPVAGSPERDERFLIPSDPSGETTPLMLAVEVDTSDPEKGSRSILFSCTAVLSCTEPMWEFPWGYQTEPNGGIWLAPDYTDSGTIFVVQSTAGSGEDVLAWRSGDGGETFTKWRSVDALAESVEVYEGARPDISLGMSEAFPRRVYLRLRYTAAGEAKRSPPAPPAEQIFRSDDLGETWKRVAAGYSIGQRDAGTRRHRLPWHGGFGSSVGSDQIILRPDGRLFVLASAGIGEQGVYCSTDGGKRWSALCKK